MGKQYDVIRNETTRGMRWSDAEDAWVVYDPSICEWTDDMEGVSIDPAGRMLVDGDAVAESIQQQRRDAGLDPFRETA